RNSISDESLSRSESESSVNTNGNHPAASNGAAGGGLTNGHLSNGHANGNGAVPSITSSLFKLNGTHSGSVNGNSTLLSPGAVSNKSSITLTPTNATKDENDS